MIPFNSNSHTLPSSFQSDGIDRLIADLLQDPTLIIMISGNVGPKAKHIELDEFASFDEGRMTWKQFMLRRAFAVISYLEDRGVPSSQLENNLNGGRIYYHSAEGYSVTITPR